MASISNEGEQPKNFFDLTERSRLGTDSVILEALKQFDMEQLTRYRNLMRKNGMQMPPDMEKLFEEVDKLTTD